MSFFFLHFKNDKSIFQLAILFVFTQPHHHKQNVTRIVFPG